MNSIGVAQRSCQSVLGARLILVKGQKVMVVRHDGSQKLYEINLNGQVGSFHTKDIKVEQVVESTRGGELMRLEKIQLGESRMVSSSQMGHSSRAKI